MKQTITKTFSLLILFILSLNAFAQFKTVYADKTTFYRYKNPDNATGRLGLFGPTGEFIPLKIQSQKIVDQDTIYNNYRVYRKNSNDLSDDCYATNKGWAWTGKSIVLTGDKRDVFININNDSVIFKRTATLNDSWIFSSTKDSYFLATVTKKGIETFSIYGAELTDSVLTITINLWQKGDNSPIKHDFNGKEWKISKRYGFVKAYDLLNFPQDTNALILAGINNVGVKNLTRPDVYNFEIGDIFHIREFSDTYYYTDIKIIDRIIDKKIVNKTVSYYIEHFVSTAKRNLEGEFSFEKTDTTILSINLNPSNLDNFNNLPIKIESDSSGYRFQYVHPITSTLAKVNTNFFLQASDESSDSCFKAIPDGNIISYEYIEGFGGPYYSNVINMASFPYVESRKLVYYKKGEKEWGVPFQLNTGLHTYKPNIAVSVFPCPANDRIKVSSEYIQNTHYKIYTYNGNEILNGKFETKEELVNLNNLKPGLYSIIIIKDGKAIYSSRFEKI